MNGMRQYGIAFLFICALAQGIWVGGQVHRLGAPGCQAGFKTVLLEKNCYCGTHGSASRAMQLELTSAETHHCPICQGQQAHVDVPQSFAHALETIQHDFAVPMFSPQYALITVDTLHSGRAPPLV
jgi:hypothetical protein